jgi:hypothetical protein
LYTPFSKYEHRNYLSIFIRIKSAKTTWLRKIVKITAILDIFIIIFILFSMRIEAVRKLFFLVLLLAVS